MSMLSQWKFNGSNQFLLGSNRANFYSQNPNKIVSVLFSVKEHVKRNR